MLILIITTLLASTVDAPNIGDIGKASAGQVLEMPVETRLELDITPPVLGSTMEIRISNHTDSREFSILSFGSAYRDFDITAPWAHVLVFPEYGLTPFLEVAPHGRHVVRQRVPSSPDLVGFTVFTQCLGGFVGGTPAFSNPWFMTLGH